jgi:peroxiredoxin Q/BCP
MIRIGELIPYFSLYNQDNKIRRNDDYSNCWMILFVYPKDDTPGCTIEAKGFTGKKSEFERLNTKLVGISNDDVNSHKNFCSKHNLGVELLSDPEEKLLKELGIEKKEFNGNYYWSRTTIIADEKGKVQFVFSNVNAEGHENEVLSKLKRLKEETY